MDAALETGGDAIFWDEPHLYSAGNKQVGCYCTYCRNLVEQGKPVIASFLRDVCGAVKSRGGENVVCVLPSTLERNDIPDLETVMSLGSTPFWGMHGDDPVKYVTRIGRQLIQVASRKHVETHLWIQGFNIPAWREVEITNGTIAAGQLGIDVLAIWGFDACESMSSLSCERPQIAWAAFLKAIEHLRNLCDFGQ
jgi:hypothetical protein